MMKDYKHIQHIFFDLDHTLWDFDKNSEIAFGSIFKQYHPLIKIDDFIKIYEPINQACWKLFQKDLITHTDLKYNRLRESFVALDYSITDAEIDFISDKYLELLPENNALFEGAIGILDYLKPNYKLHIITNGFAKVQEKKIVNSGLKSYFETITNSEMAGVKKPNPAIYEHALGLAGAKKNNSIMIGDCIDADVYGALDFGIDAIYFNPNGVVVNEQIVQIKQLVDLKELF
jgi:YjjG family noncanonical pyrimidine nucleotidase